MIKTGILDFLKKRKRRKKRRNDGQEDGWEVLEPSKVPKWIRDSAIPGVNLDYFQCIELKGKHYRYMVCMEPKYQGDKSVTFYRKLRRRWREKRNIEK